MYFPYLRGKQYEVLAVRDSGFLSSNRIIPVFEPTTLAGPTPFNRFLRIANNGVKFSVIVNSVSGKPPPALANTIQVLRELESRVPGAVLPAFQIRPGQPVSDVGDFARTFASQQCVLVHRNHTHSETALSGALNPLSRPPVQILLEGGTPLQVVKALPAVGMVLLRDGFSRCTRNADYPIRSNFDDLLYTYRSLGFDGFSDFSIVGDTYSPGGGAAIHVAIHLTELYTTTIVANHFVSKTPPQRGNDQAKYFSALSLLMSYTGSPPSADLDTEGVREYHQSNSLRHYPGLGKLKQWSIMHHMEIIDRKLGAMNTSSFV